MPSVFVCHGSPMLAIQENEYTDSLRKLGDTFQPKAIVIFTAHWEAEVTTISFRDDVYPMIYDFGGFDPSLYEIVYPAKGSREVATNVERALIDRGIRVKRDEQRGLDHGSWVVLQKMYPDASIPVVQVSVNPFLSPSEQFAIGNALRGLAHEDVLVVGSGGTSHNLRMIKWGQVEPEAWTVEFDNWLLDRLATHNYAELFNYAELAPHARLAVPRAEHFVPFFIAAGAGMIEEMDTTQTLQAKVHFRGYEFGTLSLISVEM